MPLMSPFLIWTCCIYFKFKTNQYLHGICPLQKMSNIGKFRRNFATFEQTMQFIHIYFFYGYFFYGLSFSLFQAFSLEPQTNFLLSNISDFLYMNVFHGIFLPMNMKIPPTLSLNRRRRASHFFVRRPQFLEPRRPVQSEEQNSTRGSASLFWTEESMQPTKIRRRKRDKVSCARSSSTDLHRETETSSSGNTRLNAIFTTGDLTQPSAVIQMLPHSAGQKRRNKSLEDLSSGKKSIGESNSPSNRNPTRRLDNMSKEYITGIRKADTAERKSQTIEVEVHGSMSQRCDQIENSRYRASRSDPIVPIDI